MLGTTAKRSQLDLRDLVDADPLVVALEGFTAMMRQPVTRGAYYRLSDDRVRLFPQYFALVVPAEKVLDAFDR